MIGSILTRGLVTVFAYIYPAYECYKAVEQNKPDFKKLRFWCQYWILVAVLTVCERIGDTFVSWIPMYSEAKLAFIIYLWYPKTKGTTYVYDSFLRPYIAKHEREIDRNLWELRTRAEDLAVFYWQRATSYGQTRILKILQFVASQSTPRPRSAQSQQQREGTRARQSSTPKRQPSTSSRQPAARQPETEDPPSPTSSTSSSPKPTEVAEDPPAKAPEAAAPAKVPEAAAPAKVPEAAAPSTSSNVQRANSVPETSSQSTPVEAEEMQIEAVDTSSGNANAKAKQNPKESVMEKTIRVTRGRFRKTRSVPNR